MFSIYIHIKNVEFTGSRGFSSGSGFGFRGRRARDSDTLGTYSSLVSNSIHALQITHFSHIRIFVHTHHTHTFSIFSQLLFFFLWLSTIIFIIYLFFNEDVEVNELKDLRAVWYMCLKTENCCLKTFIKIRISEKVYWNAWNIV